MASKEAPLGFTNDRYTSSDFLQREKKSVFRKTWIAVARESDVARPGDCIPVDELDESLIVVRGTDGTIRTFHNSCRHRGMRLVAGTCSMPKITCPYHGWTYDLKGQIVGVPKVEGFADFDLRSHGLDAIRTECWAGFVWITFNPEAPPILEYLRELAPHLEPYRLSEMRPLLRRTWTLQCNWKAVLDQASESYHLRSVHPALGRVVDTALTFHALDPHFLQTVPMPDSSIRTWLDRFSVPDDLPVTSDQLDLFHKCVIFPNTLLNVMPYHLTVFRVFPITADTCRFHYEFYVRPRAGLIGRLRVWSTLLASLYILREDLRMLPSYQLGVKASAHQTIPFHCEEQALEYFQQVLDRFLAP